MDGIEPIGGIVQKSEATQVCKAIGGILPDDKKFHELAVNWHKKIVPQHFEKEMYNVWFVSSRVEKSDDSYGFVFNGAYPYSNNYIVRYILNSVRCVAP